MIHGNEDRKNPQANPERAEAGIPLVFAADEGYAMPLATALRSIVESKRNGGALEVYVLHNTFRHCARMRVMESVPSRSVSFRWVHSDLTCFEAYSTSSYISKITYARLLLPDLLPRAITKLLYLDADILVFDDLSALQAVDLGGAAIGAVSDRLDSRIKAGEALWTTELPRVRNYFNAGVLLIDLERWREQRISERSFEYLAQHPRSPLSDQDALNVACDGAWKQIGPRWNFLNDFHTRLSGMASGEGPAILHFAGPMKPWQIGILDPNARLYDLVRSRTRFARTRHDKWRDAFYAPLRFVQSDPWWQFKRAVKQHRVLRRIALHAMYLTRAKARVENGETP